MGIASNPTMVTVNLFDGLTHLGGVADYAALSRCGIARTQVLSAAAEGAIYRVRNGWFALHDAPDDLVAAVRVGGRLSCVSALRRADVWCLSDGRLHVCVDRHASYVASPIDRAAPIVDSRMFGIALHRGEHHPAEPSRPAIEPILDAMSHLFTCRPKREAIAVLDSALNGKHVTKHQVAQLMERLPKKYGIYLASVDASAQSGTETFVRLRLKQLNIRFRSQAFVAGVGTVDFLVGERFVIEVDSKKWHTGSTAFEEDRRRDLDLHALGYLVLRLSYNQVMYKLEEAVAVIRSIVSRREHLWSGRHLRRGFGS
ncbi:MAG: hypothetical protein JWQ64_3141 [Subtercola sp.]|nr:hypothetical protein [Subtercola sp.]